MGKKYYGNMNYIPKYPDFNNPDVWQDLNRQCYDGTLDYSSFPADEYKYFDRLRLLYLEFKFNCLDREAAVIEKQRLKKEYEWGKYQLMRSAEIYGVYQDNIKRFNELRIKINKADSEKEKLRIALEIIGIVINDEKVFPKINMQENYETEENENVDNGR